MGEEKANLEALKFDKGWPVTVAFRLQDCWPTFSHSGARGCFWGGDGIVSGGV